MRKSTSLPGLARLLFARRGHEQRLERTLFADGRREAEERVLRFVQVQRRLSGKIGRERRRGAVRRTQGRRFARRRL